MHPKYVKTAMSESRTDPIAWPAAACVAARQAALLSTKYQLALVAQ
jgi:hypothetical protein